MIGNRTRVQIDRRVKVGENSLGEEIWDYVTDTYHGDLVPLGSEEPLRAGTVDNPVITRYRLILPTAAAISSGDRMKINGHTYEVIGEPEWHNLHGRGHHLEAVVQRRTG